MHGLDPTTGTLAGLEVMTPAEAARLLRVEESVVTAAAWKGQLPGVWTGADLYLDRRRLLRMLDPPDSDAAAGR